METIDYSQHRMYNFDWVKSYIAAMGKDQFDAFLNRAYKRLMSMKLGDRYDLTKKVREKNRDLFIKIACLFIQSGNIDYSFNDQYTLITKALYEKPLQNNNHNPMLDHRNTG